MLFTAWPHAEGPCACGHPVGFLWLLSLQEETCSGIIFPASTSVQVLKVKAVGRAHRSCACHRCSSDRRGQIRAALAMATAVASPVRWPSPLDERVAFSVLGGGCT